MFLEILKVEVFRVLLRDMVLLELVKQHMVNITDFEHQVLSVQLHTLQEFLKV